MEAEILRMSNSSQHCLEVRIKSYEYKNTIANGYVVLAFFLSLIFTAIAVFVFSVYVLKKLREEAQREQESQRRRKIRQIAAKRFKIDEEEDSFAENMQFETNYLWSVDPDGEDKAERSQSRISFALDDGKQSLNGFLLEIVASLFTSNRNSSSPTSLTSCFELRETCFDLIKSVHQESYSCVLRLMLHVLFEEKVINETEKLHLTTKYEQMMEEKFKPEEIADYTNRLHFVLAKTENEIQDVVEKANKAKQLPLTGEYFGKYMTVFQRELLSYRCNVLVKEMVVNTENWLVKILMDRWFNLEVIRYRINIVYVSIEEALKKKGEMQDVLQGCLNRYLVDICENMSKYCTAYEKELFDLLEQIKKDKQSNRKQATMELETQRFERRDHAIQNLEYTKKKAVSKFVIAQIDSLLSDLKTMANYEVVISSESFELFEGFQKVNNKKVVKLLRTCEEELFEQVQKDALMMEDDIIALGKKMSVDLKDFKTAQERIKTDYLEFTQSSIRRIGSLLDCLYSVLERKFTKGIEDMKQASLELLHSLSNIEEEEMNRLEHEFEIGFSSLVFSLYFVVMTQTMHTIHSELSDIITKYTVDDASLSLHDLVNVLRQDKKVIKQASFFQMPNKDLYPIIERELVKVEGTLSRVLDGYLQAFSQKLEKFFLPKISSIIQDSIFKQSHLCLSNLNVGKEKMLSCSTNSKGYTSKQASLQAKDCFEQIGSIWESQANFKAHQVRERKGEIMQNFEPLIETFFDGQGNKRQSSGALQESLQLEMQFFESLEKLLRSNSVERVLDCNLENELMIVKLHEKIDSFEPRTGYDELNSSRRRLAKSHSSDSGSVRRKESLRQSITRKNRKA